MNRLRAAVGWKLRCLADRIDREHSVRISAFTFTFEQGKGAVFHTDLNDPMHGRGCPVAYFAHEYNRAHDEAAS